MSLSEAEAPIQVLQETPDWVLCVKPAGLTYQDLRNEHGEVVREGLVSRLKHELDCPLYGVHRLDAMTTGLMLVAKSSSAANRLTTLFQKRQIDKWYLAISDQKPKKKQGWVVGDMLPSRRGNWKLLPSKTAPAVTYFISSGLGDGTRAFLVKPYTGKTHQIRVALKSMGAAILGDVRYNNKSKCLSQEERFSGRLHAYALRFEWNDQEWVFKLAPNEDFGGVVLQEHLNGAWSKPWELDWPKWKET